MSLSKCLKNEIRYFPSHLKRRLHSQVSLLLNFDSSLLFIEMSRFTDEYESGKYVALYLGGNC